MKEALDKEGLKTYLMVQPVGYHTPDTEIGFVDLPETPFGKWDFKLLSELPIHLLFFYFVKIKSILVECKISQLSRRLIIMPRPIYARSSSRPRGTPANRVCP